MSSPPDHNHSSVTLKNTQPDEEKDYVPSNETSGSSSEIAISAHESVDKTTDSKEYVDSDRKGSSVEVDKTDEKCRVLNLFPSEDSALTCQHSMVSDAPQNTERAGSSSEIDLEGEYRTSFMKLLQGVQVSLEDSNQVSPNMSPGDCSSEIKGFQSMKEPTKSSVDSSEPGCCSQQDGDVLSCQKPTLKEKGKKVLKEEKKAFDWDCLRREAQARAGIREKTRSTMDTVDWKAIRAADVKEVAETIKSRGMNHKLAERIQVKI